MFGKIVAISTVKHLSRNYASFSNQVCKSGIAYPLLVRRKISRMDTADFHGDGYILQNTGLTKDLRIAFVVCDVNSEKEQLQVNFLIWEQIFSSVNETGNCCPGNFWICEQLEQLLYSGIDFTE